MRRERQRPVSAAGDDRLVAAVVAGERVVGDDVFQTGEAADREGVVDEEMRAVDEARFVAGEERLRLTNSRSDPRPAPYALTGRTPDPLG